MFNAFSYADMSIACVIVFDKIWVSLAKTIHVFNSGLCVFCINSLEFYFASSI